MPTTSSNPFIYYKHKKSNPDGLLFRVLVAEMGFEPHDLRVMSPTSYRTAPLRDIYAVSLTT